MIIDGRRWRATDTSVPEALRAELVKELMRARRLVRTRGGPSDAARVVGGTQWRDVMPVARDVARELHEERVVVVQQGGAAVDPARASGPIRLAPGPALER